MKTTRWATALAVSAALTTAACGADVEQKAAPTGKSVTVTNCGAPLTLHGIPDRVVTNDTGCLAPTRCWIPKRRAWSDALDMGCLASGISTRATSGVTGSGYQEANRFRARAVGSVSSGTSAKCRTEQGDSAAHVTSNSPHRTRGCPGRYRP